MGAVTAVDRGDHGYGWMRAPERQRSWELINVIGSNLKTETTMEIEPEKWKNSDNTEPQQQLTRVDDNNHCTMMYRAASQSNK